MNNNQVVLDTSELEPIDIELPKVTQGDDIRSKFFGAPGSSKNIIDYETLRRRGYIIVEVPTKRELRKKGILKRYVLYDKGKRYIGGIICKVKPENVKVVDDIIKKRVRLEGKYVGTKKNPGYTGWRHY